MEQEVAEHFDEFAEVRVFVAFSHEIIDEFVAFFSVFLGSFSFSLFYLYPIFYVLENYQNVQNICDSSLKHVNWFSLFSLFVFFLLFDDEIQGVFI